jgi:dTDP-4-dehydrorhamnose reductase
MKFLIFGHKGWIGKMIVGLLKQQGIEYACAECRADDKEGVENEIRTVQPTHCMSLIGRTHGVYEGKEYTTIDYLEQKGKVLENVRDNLFSPVVLGLICKKYNVHFTYLGTGCIFTYKGDGNDEGFTEDALPNFFGSSYSIVKGYTDELMHLLDDTVLNVRIRMPITDTLEPRNFITKITKYDKICSVPNSMTVLDELLPIVVSMACKNTIGTINLTNPGLISHDEILHMYKEIVDPGFTWKNFTREEQAKILDADRSNNFLDTHRLTSMYPNVKHIKDSVRDTLTRMKKNIYKVENTL